ncbi:uncharacterized protein LOC116603149 [Nematostella vectensis]|uniref:uncharacterized protein LOC116603149 n=1 Tax=Nematostella vectensis TaxID=45351 RepID=UPI00207744BE|nr:uncharacterized protein LOC116603149 [Nematostella vectensis]
MASRSPGARTRLGGRPMLSPEDPMKRKKTWEQQHIRVRLLKDVYSTWQELRKASIYASDSAFASHLLSLELRRRERFTKTTTGGPKQKAAAIREPPTSTPVGKHHNKMADPEISLSEAGSDQGDKYEAYKARKQLSAIDWNFHQGREKAVNDKGEQMVSRKYNRGTKEWNLRIIKVGKTCANRSRDLVGGKFKPK